MAEQLHTALTILRRKQVEKRTGLPRSSIYAKLDPNSPATFDPTFPKQIAIGARAVGWLESEIEAWLARRVKTSRDSVDQAPEPLKRSTSSEPPGFEALAKRQMRPRWPK